MTQWPDDSMTPSLNHPIARSPNGWRARLRKAFSFPVLLGVVVGAGVFGLARLNLPDPDAWSHLATGEHILATGAWPTTDSYSFTAHGSDWIEYEWLGQVAMALAARAAGLQGLAALVIGLAMTVMLLLYYYAYLRSGNAKAAFVACALLLPAAAGFFRLRPQLLGYSFLLITLICLEFFRQGRRKALWILPGLFVLWVNTHATFVFGLMAMGLYWASGLAGFRVGGLRAERWTAEQRRRLAAVFLLCLLALTITPYGTRLAASPLLVILNSRVGLTQITEYQPISAYAPLLKLFLGLLVALLLAQVLFRPTYRVEEMGLLLLAAYLASAHTRFLLLFVLVFTPLLAALLARWIPQYHAAKDHHAVNAALMALVALGLLRAFPSSQEVRGAIAQYYPQRAAEYLRQNPVAGPMFNEYGWGGYLIWSLDAREKIFIDGRSQLYEENGVFADYLRITHLDRQTPVLLRKYGIGACLIERKTALATFLEALPDWERAYEDDLSVMFVHKEPGSGSRILDSGLR